MEKKNQNKKLLIALIIGMFIGFLSFKLVFQVIWPNLFE